MIDEKTGKPESKGQSEKQQLQDLNKQHNSLGRSAIAVRNDGPNPAKALN